MADSEDKKPEKKEGGEGSLNIRIRDQTGEETFFKVKKTTKLDKVFNAYSTRKGVAATSLRFLFDGSRVRGDQTPADIDMEVGDQLDCFPWRAYTKGLRKQVLGLRSLALRGRAGTRDEVMRFIVKSPNEIAWKILSYWPTELDV